MRMENPGDKLGDAVRLFPVTPVAGLKVSQACALAHLRTRGLSALKFVLPHYNRNDA